MTEKRQTSQGYIIRILQHFATKLWNITNFVMLFQAVMKFCLDLFRSKFWLIGEWSIQITSILQAVSFCRKTACNVKEVEIIKAMRLTKTYIEPFVFSVPRVQVRSSDILESV